MKSKKYKIEFEFERVDKNTIQMETKIHATPTMLRMAMEKLVEEIEDMGILKRLLSRFIERLTR